MAAQGWRLRIVAIWTALLTAVVGQSQVAPGDSVAQLQRRMDEGTASLGFEENRGYLPAVLKALDIPVSSQTLVFSKTSIMHEYISPATPRAVYFNDSTYVASSVGGPVLEIASIDPQQGLVFYELEQNTESRPRFRRETVCLLCHDPSQSGAPRLIMRSHYTDRGGHAFQSNTVADLTFSITDETPFARRWGGWYVTGTHGSQWHMGNMRSPESIQTLGTNLAKAVASMDRTSRANLTDLSGLLDTRFYLTLHSDIVALMVLGHQTHVQNLMAATAHAARSGADIVAPAETLVRAMLFVKEVQLSAPLKGTSTFAADFASTGSRDRSGRSLRDFDLNTRLFRYPLSYLIYSVGFNALPERVKTFIYTRLLEVLRGYDRSKAFTHLTLSDREALLGILRDTKPDFPQVDR